jgi:hypothetical protein
LRTRLAAALLLGVVALAAALPAVAANKVRVDAISVEAVVRGDGSVVLTEHRVIDLPADTTSITWEVFKRGVPTVEILEFVGPTGAYTVADMNATGEVPPPRTYVVTETEDRVTVRAFFRKREGLVEFACRYRVPGATAIWGDFNSMYQLLDSSAEGLPRPRVRMQFGDAPTAPASVAEDPDGLAFDRELWATLGYWVAAVAGVVVPLAALIAALRFFLKRSREHESDFDERHLSEPPSDLAPALVGILLHGRRPGGPEIAATIASLADRRYLALEPPAADGSGPWLVRKKADLSDLQKHERELVKLVFGIAGSEDRVAVTALRARLESDSRRAAAARAGIRRWRRALHGELYRNGLLERATRAGIAGSALLSSLVAMAGVPALLLRGTWLALGWSILAGVVTFLLRISPQRLTPRGVDLRMRYAAFRAFLASIEQLLAPPVGPAPTWVYRFELAAGFGLAERVMLALEEKVPRTAAAVALDGWRALTDTSHDGRSPLRMISEGSCAFVRAAFRAPGLHQVAPPAEEPCDDE